MINFADIQFNEAQLNALNVLKKKCLQNKAFSAKLASFDSKEARDEYEATIISRVFMGLLDSFYKQGKSTIFDNVVISVGERLMASKQI